MRKKVFIVLLVLAALAAFWALDLQRYFTLEYIKQSRQQFQALYARHPVTLIGAYMLIYILITALSLPGATVATLAGAAMLGFWPALVAVSFASSIGATLACFLARFVLRDWVQKKFGHKLEPIHQGMEREGAFYLFTLRLVPVFPFFLINLAMGLTRLPLFTYYWVSQVGMLPGTVVYVFAGTELGKLTSLSGILSPGLITAFVILGLFPLSVKKLLAWYRSRRETQA